MKKNISIILTSLLMFAGMIAANTASAANVINSVLVNGTSSVVVAPNSNITISINATADTGNNKWQSTKYQIGNLSSVCVNTTDHNNSTNTESFSTSSPSSSGFYDLNSWVYTNDTCTAGQVGPRTLSNGIHVVIPDTQAPVITAPATQTFEATGATTSPAGLTKATATDNSGTSIITYSPSIFSLGTTTVIWTATDSSSNFATTSSVVVIKDTTKPAITAPATQTFEASGISTSPTLIKATTTDLVDSNPTITKSQSSFPLGTSTVVWTSTDTSGNSATTSSLVVIHDTTAPTASIVSPALWSVVKGIVPINATASDNVGVTNMEFWAASIGTLIGTSTSPFSVNWDTTFYSDGAHSLWVKAYDAAGNNITSSLVSVLVDNFPPSFTSSNSNVVEEAISLNGTIATFPTPTATDAASTTVSVNCVPASGSAFGITTTPVTCTATDLGGNATTTSFNVTIQDTTAPTIESAPSNISATTTDTGTQVAFTSPIAYDLVDGTSTAVCTPSSGSTFSLGTTQVTCSATDSHSNTASSTFNIIVSDVGTPVLSLPENIVMEATGPDGSAVTFNATASDIGDATSTAVSCTPASGSVFSLGGTTVSCNSQDSASNTANGSFSVTIQDTTAPNITVLGDNPVFISKGSVYTDTGATSTDLVDGDTTSKVSSTSTVDTSVTGTYSVIYSVTDTAGNTATSSRSVVVKNNDASLYSLSISLGSLSPSFESETNDYTVVLPAHTTITPETSATTTDPLARVSITPAANVGSTSTSSRTTSILVTAEDGTTTKTYTITFTVAAPIDNGGEGSGNTGTTTATTSQATNTSSSSGSRSGSRPITNLLVSSSATTPETETLTNTILKNNNTPTIARALETNTLAGNTGTTTADDESGTTSDENVASDSPSNSNLASAISSFNFSKTAMLILGLLALIGSGLFFFLRRRKNI